MDEMIAIAGRHQADSAPRTAVYLRTYPFDTTAMECPRRALEELAAQAGLPEPTVYLDNGLRPEDGLPALDALLGAVRAGIFDTVLVPGPFVFGLDDARARTVVEELERHSCQVLELPAHGVHPGSVPVRVCAPVPVRVCAPVPVRVCAPSAAHSPAPAAVPPSAASPAASPAAEAVTAVVTEAVPFAARVRRRVAVVGPGLVG
ncbi:hypothetical protein [Kitasatospora sp. NPDC056181]|uniref:hypothetical protein n=1 Tax=Kitasatospora sp. NPDC056181 TaxID=3345737 RepID=UPI0035DE28FF